MLSRSMSGQRTGGSERREEGEGKTRGEEEKERTEVAEDQRRRSNDKEDQRAHEEGDAPDALEEVLGEMNQGRRRGGARLELGQVLSEPSDLGAFFLRGVRSDRDEKETYSEQALSGVSASFSLQGAILCKLHLVDSEARVLKTLQLGGHEHKMVFVLYPQGAAH